MKRIILLPLLLCLQITFGQQLKPIPTQSKEMVKMVALTKEQINNWWHYDIEIDSIPGISLDRAYAEIIKDKKGSEVIVAVLDTKLDIHHVELKGRIWTNKGEIPDNDIDDDKNGYIDDVHGWNFLGNAKGEDQIHQSTEAARIVKKYNTVFEDLKEEEIPAEKSVNYQLYKEAKKNLNKDLKKIEINLSNLRGGLSNYQKAYDKVSKILNKKVYSAKTLDSLLIKNEGIKSEIQFLKTQLNYNITIADFKSWVTNLEGELNRNHNLAFKDRAFINDDPEDITDRFYGNPNVSGDVTYEHSTPVSGIISADRNNNLGLNGIVENVKIMPVVMVANGDEFDKDIALAIRYAVDNGAHIINMSWGKSYSMNQEWVKDALIYASIKNVLLVHGAGNSNADLDAGFLSYPLDHHDGTEFVDTFLSVGASNLTADQNLKATFSNYGKQHVDLFAPGDEIYTTAPHNKYETTGGTSLSAPIISGIAALLKSYYPQITAVQLKEILLASAVQYDFKVSVQIEGESKEMNFIELSRTGGIANAFNALLLAQKITHKK